VVCAAQPDVVAAVVAERTAEVGATLHVEGRDFGVIARVTGQPLRWYGPD
jgi:hypothetical protein